ncbi:unnamed protein product (macronuclear) [Paramecium tetraurelia]|uniref:Uncharacterized protein n=1 Tax=Paramecium tetraurelia TaxID=5888 RepID=A0DTB1_PARTE|nr:uncharacterized protein GSPATT00019971001 [Paramecium tetraurelia]CAK86278.1 unnamed protein product [Paramecium tetraurelia]|eukprot:XP_001453675.1 hypothetical protein (macronuclear) [Paramecium tetraurelia strain d4-2]
MQNDCLKSNPIDMFTFHVHEMWSQYTNPRKYKVSHFNLNNSQIQNKFRIQCPKCRKLTHTYDIKNLLIENNELYLITDSSEMEKEVLNESQFSLQKNQQDAILGRRQSNAYQFQEVSEPNNKNASKIGEMLSVQANHNNPQNAFNHSQFNKKKPNLGSERISPSKQMSKPTQSNHQKKQSYQIPQQEIAIECKAKTQANTSNIQQNKINDFFKPNSNTPVATPTTNASQLLFQQTENKKPVQPQLVQQQQQQQQQLQYQQQLQQQSKTDKIFENKQYFPEEKKLSTPKYSEIIKEKENQLLKDIAKDSSNTSKEISDNSRHKRSSTGLIQETEEQASVQIIQSYFKMVQKNVLKLEKDVIAAVNNKQVDPQSIYQKLKILTTRIGDNEGELIQSIKVMQKLHQEIIGLSTPSQHRKTSSHHNTSQQIHQFKQLCEKY